MLWCGSCSPAQYVIYLGEGAGTDCAVARGSRGAGGNNVVLLLETFDRKGGLGTVVAINDSFRVDRGVFCEECLEFLYFVGCGGAGF